MCVPECSGRFRTIFFYKYRLNFKMRMFALLVNNRYYWLPFMNVLSSSDNLALIVSKQRPTWVTAAQTKRWQPKMSVNFLHLRPCKIRSSVYQCHQSYSSFACLFLTIKLPIKTMWIWWNWSVLLNRSV